MPKVKPKLAAGVGGSLPRHSMDVNRGNHKIGHGRDRATVKRIQMYKTKAYKRDREGKIIKDAGDLTKSTPEAGAGRVAPNRKWFGNTRIVEQKDLTRFRDAMAKAQADPFSVLLKQKKLPMTLVDDPDTESRALAGSQMGLLVNEPFDQTFSKKRRRKRPKLVASSYEELLNKAENSNKQYEENIERMEQDAEERAKKAAAEAPPDPDAKAGLRFDDLKNADRERVFDKGQSKRIWAELHKVVDSSDVVIQVLDARDPMGTRCAYLERFLKKQCSHKHMILLLNKADLVPTWVSSTWLKILTKEYPTLAFHSSITNPFGKGSLINLLRQFKALHPEKKSISCGLVGYPNVGKSSVINTLRGKKVSKVAPIPGETKVWQYVTMFRSIFLIDCPGVVHDSTKNSQSDAVLKGVVRIESLRGMAAEYIPALLDRVEDKYIQRTYGIKSWERAHDLLEQLARKAGKLLKGGEPDVNTVGRMMLSDFQRGKLPWFVPPPMDEVKETSTKQKSPSNKDEKNDMNGSGQGDGEEVSKESSEEKDEVRAHAGNINVEHENIKNLKVSNRLSEDNKGQPRK
ncbi:Nuclear/nucleolar GTPase 2 [Gracilariopsis chorda]|uniref:Nucleolar GTP-binding protein 2 n=1 Tax=Gracilariopsis chorda TaxID=448386 RepID=A0A2V3IVY8_9FLOR|nr:Nuclear/nucleolar GTPase 2 [Gracilariopsis chorda]|eukprot:PXF46245.1 Nuclear/nucleolar GTPase 2 [Gracilariopsis chorda]